MAKQKIDSATEEEVIAEPQTIRYIGDGNFLTGIPARDLSLEEWGELSGVIQVALIGQGLYELPAGITLASEAPAATPELSAPTG